MSASKYLAAQALSARCNRVSIPAALPRTLGEVRILDHGVIPGGLNAISGTLLPMNCVRQLTVPGAKIIGT
jgi:hypothetical protein